VFGEHGESRKTKGFSTVPFYSKNKTGVSPFSEAVGEKGDRVLQQVYKNTLEPEWESLFESVVRSPVVQSPTGLRTAATVFGQPVLLTTQ